MTQPQPNNHTRAPLWRILTITAVLSVGTGSITQGLYFVAEASCGFGRASQFLLGVVMGLIYIPAALAAGPVIRSLDARGSRLAPRTLLIVLITFAGLIALLPPALHRSGLDACWSIWLTAAAYSACTGLIWPIVEWYLSGGRKHAALRMAAGRFNIVWTSAIVACAWILAPFLERAPLDFLAVLAALHAAALAVVLGLPPRPQPPLDDETPHPLAYERLLSTARRLLPISYVLMSALAPYLVGALAAIGVAIAWQPVVVSIWLVARVVTMITLERWHGWHGSPAMLAVGAATLTLGFAGCILAPLAASLPLMAAALAVFGVGMGTIYTAALYYALEVGGHSADAGGTHEALIGAGYTAGPAIGLAAAIAVDSQAIPESGFSVAIVITAAAVCTLAYAAASRLRTKTNQNNENYNA
ncbi:MAG: hypothetical protein AAFR96_10920 [Planctomycetota bacterium]